jgi:hypothetical protein
MIPDKKLLAFYLDLPKRRREVLYWACQGLSNPEIAAKMVVAPCVVAEYLGYIFGDLQAYLPDHKMSRFLLIRLFVEFYAKHPDLEEAARHHYGQGPAFRA